jgi:hypothetical protein
MTDDDDDDEEEEGGEEVRRQGVEKAPRELSVQVALRGLLQRCSYALPRQSFRQHTVDNADAL